MVLLIKQVTPSWLVLNKGEKEHKHCKAETKTSVSHPNLSRVVFTIK